MAKIAALFIGILVLGLIATSFISAEMGKITAYVVVDTPKENANAVNVSEKFNQSQMVGNDRDSHGCIPSAGYSWCEEKSKCLRIWEENCSSIKENSDNKQKVYILPETASQKAIDAHNAICTDKNCSVQIRELVVGNQNKTAYVFDMEKPVKILGFLRANMKFKAYVDAQSGDNIKAEKPFWAFLAGE